MLEVPLTPHLIRRTVGQHVQSPLVQTQVPNLAMICTTNTIDTYGPSLGCHLDSQLGVDSRSSGPVLSVGRQRPGRLDRSERWLRRCHIRSSSRSTLHVEIKCACQSCTTAVHLVRLGLVRRLLSGKQTERVNISTMPTRFWKI